jgi:hypothetical protein
MAQKALKEPIVDKEKAQREREQSQERIARESSERYRRSVDEVNRTRDSDIEKALRS